MRLAYFSEAGALDFEAPARSEAPAPRPALTATPRAPLRGREQAASFGVVPGKRRAPAPMVPVGLECRPLCRRADPALSAAVAYVPVSSDAARLEAGERSDSAPLALEALYRPEDMVRHCRYGAALVVAVSSASVTILCEDDAERIVSARDAETMLDLA